MTMPYFILDPVVDAELCERHAPWPKVWDRKKREPCAKLCQIGRSVDFDYQRSSS